VSANGAWLLASARSEVARAVELLRRPDLSSVEESAVRLNRAAEAAGQLVQRLGEGSEMRPPLAEGLRGLEADLRRVRILLDRALEFRTGWFGTLSATLSGYSRQGGFTGPRTHSGWIVEA
jgi:hypothetical protein